jgi:hypothetical protein
MDHIVIAGRAIRHAGMHDVRQPKHMLAQFALNFVNRFAKRLDAVADPSQGIGQRIEGQSIVDRRQVGRVGHQFQGVSVITRLDGRYGPSRNGGLHVGGEGLVPPETAHGCVQLLSLGLERLALRQERPPLPVQGDDGVDPCKGRVVVASPILILHPVGFLTDEGDVDHDRFFPFLPAFA